MKDKRVNHEIRSTKFETNSKFKEEMFKTAAFRFEHFFVHASNLFGIWDLDLGSGIWGFGFGFGI
jgi:hypothetical protein